MNGTGQGSPQKIRQGCEIINFPVSSRSVAISFIINDDEESNGGARPFFAWYKASRDGKIISFDNRIKLRDENNIFQVSSIREASGIVEGSDYIVADDRNAQLALDIRTRTGIPVAIYCQVPFGLHSLGIRSDQFFNLRSIEYRLSRYVPFNILARNYIKRLNSANLVIANSFAMHYLLTFVYGIFDNGIIYPPLDRDVFHADPSISKDSISLFLGREEDWNNNNIIQVLAEVAEEKGLLLQLFGRKTIHSSLFSDIGPLVFNDFLSNEELVKLYNRSYITISIQKQEFFGYVPIESISCGTPALTTYLHDALLLTPDLNCMIMQSDDLNMRKDVLKILENYAKYSHLDCAERLAEMFSSRLSYHKLKEILDKHWNCK